MTPEEVFSSEDLAGMLWLLKKRPAFDHTEPDSNSY